MSTTPNPFAMPMNDLAAAAGITPAVEPTPAAPAATPAPAVATPATPAPIVPEKYTIASDDTGFTITLSPEYGGEVFKGKDLNEVVTKLAASKADGNAYIKTLKAQPPTTTPEPTPTPNTAQLSPDEQATLDWMETLQAKRYGMSLEEYRAQISGVFNTTQQMSQNIAFAEFHRLCPDYVDNQENSDIVASYFPEGYQPSDAQSFANDLKQAYAMAIYDGKITRQTAQPAPVAPKTPPVMPSAGATPAIAGGQNPWTMPMDQLAALAGINQ